MDKAYQPAQFEDKIYQLWQKAGFFTPKIKGLKKTFSIIMPPPNANGQLHIGHALFITLQDILVRYQRLKGRTTLWLPGADHAGILTQVVFERYLKKEGKTRYDLGRDEFYKQCLAFTQKNKELMFRQMEKLGASCDWSRARFTLDKDISQTVAETFVRLYEDGLVYRAERMINWCPRCQTALSDLEVVRGEKKGKLYYIKYKLKNANGKTKAVIVATTRPETMLGDTAVAVNPKDKRCQNLIGKIVILPLMKREIPVVADKNVDPNFGTGAVKVTPFHDSADFEIGQRHHLESIQVIGFDNEMTKNAGKYENLIKHEARKKILADLKKQKLIDREENYLCSFADCERCQTEIEPLVSPQWFVKIKPLAKAAIKAVREQKIKIIPKRFAQNYFNWMENIHDWCISRQIWWGQQLPVWYCLNCGGLDKNKIEKLYDEKGLVLPIVKREIYSKLPPIVDKNPPQKCPECGSSQLYRDPDTFDTWFSSAQWPYTTLGFNWNGKQGCDFKYFYPTSVMETGYEILFIWVTKMIMLGLYVTKDVPFRTVYLHGLVRDALGEKMSKSLGNIINPLDVIEKYGADALRLALIWGIAPGNDSNIGEEKIRAMRNFANKLWNISRFVLIHKHQSKIKSGLAGEKLKITIKNLKLKDDKEMVKKLNMLVSRVTKNIENFRFSQAIEALHHFAWHEFADKYIEDFKSHRGNLQSLWTLDFGLLTLLKLLHPFIPFVTEAIWQEFSPKGAQPLINQPWPKAK